MRHPETGIHHALVSFSLLHLLDPSSHDNGLKRACSDPHSPSDGWGPSKSHFSQSVSVGSDGRSTHGLIMAVVQPFAWMTTGRSQSSRELSVFGKEWAEQMDGFYSKHPSSWVDKWRWRKERGSGCKRKVSLLFCSWGLTRSSDGIHWIAPLEGKHALMARIIQVGMTSQKIPSRVLLDHCYVEKRDFCEISKNDKRILKQYRHAYKRRIIKKKQFYLILSKKSLCKEKACSYQQPWPVHSYCALSTSFRSNGASLHSLQNQQYHGKSELIRLCVLFPVDRGGAMIYWLDAFQENDDRSLKVSWQVNK